MMIRKFKILWIIIIGSLIAAFYNALIIKDDKLLGILLGVPFPIVAVYLVLFEPDGREMIPDWLYIPAKGSFKLKTSSREYWFQTFDEKRDKISVDECKAILKEMGIPKGFDSKDIYNILMGELINRRRAFVLDYSNHAKKFHVVNHLFIIEYRTD